MWKKVYTHFINFIVGAFWGCCGTILLDTGINLLFKISNFTPWMAILAFFLAIVAIVISLIDFWLIGKCYFVAHSR